MRTRRAIALAILMSCVRLAELDAQLRLRTLATGFSSPIAAVQDPTDRNVQLVVQQDGHVRVLRGASVLSADFLDVSSSILASISNLADSVQAGHPAICCGNLGP